MLNSGQIATAHQGNGPDHHHRQRAALSIKSKQVETAATGADLGFLPGVGQGVAGGLWLVGGAQVAGPISSRVACHQRQRPVSSTTQGQPG